MTITSNFLTWWITSRSWKNLVKLGNSLDLIITAGSLDHGLSRFSYCFRLTFFQKIWTLGPPRILYVFQFCNLKKLGFSFFITLCAESITSRQRLDACIFLKSHNLQWVLVGLRWGDWNPWQFLPEQFSIVTLQVSPLCVGVVTQNHADIATGLVTNAFLYCRIFHNR